MDAVRLAEMLKNDNGSGVTIRQGKVTAYSTTTKLASVTIGGSETILTGIKSLSAYMPVVGESVMLLVNGSDLFILGTVHGGDTGWLTSGITAASDWSITEQRYRRSGDVVSFTMTVQRTGASITVLGTGDVANTAAATMPAAFRPTQAQALAAFATGPVQSWFINGSGVVTLAATAPGMTITSGTNLSVGGTYLLG